MIKNINIIDPFFSEEAIVTCERLLAVVEETA
jgi:hypothetical protein